MSRPVQTEYTFSIEDIVRDVRERGDVALADWSRRLDGTTAIAPERASAYGDIPTAAVLDAAHSVRTWHEAQRPHDIMLEVSPGVTLERRWSALRSVGGFMVKAHRISSVPDFSSLTNMHYLDAALKLASSGGK